MSPFVKAASESLPEGWTLKPPTRPGDCVWRAIPPGPDTGRIVGIVDAGWPSVDCRNVAVKLDRYKLEPRLDGAFLPDRMLGHYVLSMCEMAAGR